MRATITRRLDVRAAQSALPAWLQTASSGALPAVYEWVEVPNSKLSDCPVTWAGPGTVPPPDTGTGVPNRGKLTAWNGATLKHSGSVYMIACSGGHGDYSGNEVNAITLGADTIAGWQELLPPSAYADIINEAELYLDGRPSSIHTYWSLQFDQSRNRLIRVAKSGLLMSGIPSRPADWPAVHGGLSAFDVATGDWLASGTLAAMPAGLTDYSSVCCDPTTGDIYWVPGNWWQMYRYRPSLNAWTQIGETNNGTAYCAMAIDHTRGRMLKVGSTNTTPSNGYTPKVFDVAAGGNVSVLFGGLGESALSIAGEYPGCVYDSHNDCFWVMRGNVSSESSTTVAGLYRVEAGTWSVSAPTMTGTLPKAPVNGVVGKLQYVPELKGLVIADRYTENLKFVRTA